MKLKIVLALSIAAIGGMSQSRGIAESKDDAKGHGKAFDTVEVNAVAVSQDQATDRTDAR
ncbi:MAG: hypothetical protein R3F11_27445 [Verrucomicrobiales bacterium]